MSVGTGEENLEEFGEGGVLGDRFVRIFVDVHETCGDGEGNESSKKAEGRRGSLEMSRRELMKFTCTAARCEGLGGRGRWVPLRGDPSLLTCTALPCKGVAAVGVVAQWRCNW
jgi:hypothetical protein